jgi:HNH endonuclease
MDWSSVLGQIEDQLFPRLGLTVWERAVYYHLLRQTWVSEQDKTQSSVAAVAAGAGMSEWKAREALRSLHQKGCIKIEERSRAGHDIRVLLPADLNLPSTAEAPPPDLGSIDLFSGRQYLDALLARESGRCFYCLREVNRDTCELDHATSQMDGGDNTYKNIVVSCHDCNTLKQGMKAEEHLRRVFRRNLLSDAELQERMAALDALRKGDLVPEL